MTLDDLLDDLRGPGVYFDGTHCGPEDVIAEIERLRAALEEAEIYFGDEWPDKIRAMTRANEQTAVKEEK